MQEWRKRSFSPQLAAGKPRRKTPLDRRPNWKSKGKLRKRCCEVEGMKTIWGTTRKIQTFPHPPVNVAGKVRAAAGKVAGVADRVQASRIHEKSRKEPKNYLLPPTHSLRRNISCRRKNEACDGHTQPTRIGLQLHVSMKKRERWTEMRKLFGEGEAEWWGVRKKKMEKMVRGGAARAVRKNGGGSSNIW